MAEHNELGRRGENEAAEFLAKKGYVVLHRNWRYKKLEIDIVAQCKRKLVVVEVKARGTGIWGDPEEAITKSKIKFLAEAVEAYIEEFDIDMEVRFDVVTVVFNGDAFLLEHIEEAFHPLVNG
ncbi:MAG: YraN family protein [Breznakibacter sp.]